MAGDASPFVIKASPRTRLAAFALGLSLIAVGLVMISDESGGLLGYGAAPRVRLTVAGWLVLGLGAVVSWAGLLAVIRGCPALELREDGIFYSRCLQGVTHVSWNDFDRVELKRTSVTGMSGSDINLEGIELITSDGRRIGIAPIVPAAELERAFTRAAAMFKVRCASA